MKVVLTAAHAGYAPDQHALGGGAAVARALAKEWSQDPEVVLTVLGSGPGWNGFPNRTVWLASPPASPEKLSTRAYARFSHRFEQAATRYLEDLARRTDPAKTAVLCNDISEGVDFQKVSRLGYPITLLVHVDVVEIFSRVYLGARLAPETLTRWYERAARAGWTKFFPDIFRLVFQKQRDAMLYSRHIVVPSQKMARVLEACYGPAIAPKIHVIPWGVLEEPRTPLHSPGKDSRITLMTLSRISPEKGLDILLEALLLWERQGQVPPTRLLLCGGSAYMQGPRYERKLRSLAQKLKSVRVEFTGHLNADAKASCFHQADLFVCPSRHESYGLTIVEALRAGVPVLSSNHHSAPSLIHPDYGVITDYPSLKEAPQTLLTGLQNLLSKPRAELQAMGQKAQAASRSWNFTTAAESLKSLITPIDAPLEDLVPYS